MSDFTTYFKSCISDINLFLRHNKLPIIIIVLVLTWGKFLVQQWHDHRFREDFATFYEDPDLTVVDGEDYRELNAPYRFMWGEQHFGRRYLKITTPKTEELDSIIIQYDFEVKRSGRYKIFIAGSPPGSRAEGGPDNAFSPYQLVVDALEPLEIYEEKKRQELDEATKSSFYMWYEYAFDFHFTKAGEFQLEKGKHTLEFRIHDTRLYDENFFFYMDAFFVVPEDWKPKKSLFTFPANLFSY